MRTASFASMIGTGVALLVACGGLVDQGSTPDGEIGAPDRGGSVSPQPKTETAASADVVAADVGTPSAIAMTEDRVYFTTRSTLQNGVMNDAGALFAVFKRLGSKPLMLSTDSRSAHYEALAIDGTHAYVATSDSRLFRIPLEGGSEDAIADLSAPAVSITVDATHVVFATSAGVVERVPKDGTGAIEAVATVAGRPRAVTVDDDGAVYVATSVTEGEGGSIVKITGAGEPSVLTTSASSPCAMMRDGDSLYFSASSAVHRLSLAGGPPTTVTAGSFAACALAADKDDLFFATAGGAGLMRAPATGGESTPITAAKRALSTPGAVAVDASHVYWLDATSVLRVVKPTR
jgi:sugar lactone lactonase YvrE